MSTIDLDDIELIYKKSNDKIVSVRQGTFMDLLNELEKVSVDFVDLSGFNNYIFMTQPNEYNYIIHKITNNKETYIFQFKKINQQNVEQQNVEQQNVEQQNNITFENIPNDVFKPEDIYDFEINITQKKFKKLNQYTVINISDIINNEKKKESDSDSDKAKKKSLLQKLFGC